MQQTSKYKGPLAGLNVIDFGHYYAGPMAAMLLADQGANVIRVVKPGKPELPDPQYRVLNRNKMLLELDLKTNEGKAQALSLIERADILIENFRPGVMQRLDLDYASVKYKNPGLIYLSLPGFASTDSERAHIRAWEGVLSSAMSMFTNYSLVRQGLGYPPLYTPLAHCSVYGACHAVVAVTAALLARQRHGYGTKIEAPLVEAGLAGCTTSFTSRTYKTRSNHKPNMEGFKYAPEDNENTQTEKLGRAANAIWPSVYKLYTTADGRKFQCWGFYNPNPEYAVSIHKALGIYDVLIEEGFQYLGPWKTDVDFNISAPQMLSPKRAQRVEELMEAAFAGKTADEWEKLLNNFVSSKIRTREEFFSLEPMHKSEVLTRMGHGSSQVVMPGRLCDIDGPGGARTTEFKEPMKVNYKSACSVFGERKADPLQAPPSSQHKGDLLRGLRILDLANVMAVPMANYILAQYGAEVISSVDPKKSIFPDNIRDLLEASMGKRSIIIDAATAPGREVLQRLIMRSDVVLHNILDQNAFRLGVSHEQIHKVNPNVVTCQASAWGGTVRGWSERRPGVDMTVLAETGIQAKFGSLSWPQYFGLGSVVDSISALGAAFAALLGVWQQRTTGYAGEARTSLVRGNCFLQLPWMIEENGICDWEESWGQSAIGNSWRQRIYQCSDGWIYIEAPEADASTLIGAVLEARPEQTDDGSLVAALAAQFIEHKCAHWQTRLTDVDIGCHKITSIEDLCEKPRFVDNEEADEIAQGSLDMLCWKDHPSGLPVTLPAPTWVRIGEQQSYKRCRPSPRRGEHTRQVLFELGYSEEEIAEMIATKVAHEFLPSLGRPEAYFFNS